MNDLEVLFDKDVRKSSTAYFKDIPGPSKRGLTEWLMRQYFSEKNSKEIWFDESVTPETVLEYISYPRNHFPLTPREVVDFYKSMKSLQTTLNVKKVSEEIDSLFQKEVDSELEEAKNKSTMKHFVGETSLFDIGNELGGITRTMVNKIEKIALEKYASLFNGKYPNTLLEQEHEQISEKISTAQLRAAEKYIEIMKQCTSVNRPSEFIELLKAKDYISNRENISDNEQFGIMMLFDYLNNTSEELIQEMLICDNNEDNNVFKTFQYFVSNALYQRKKRGRPRKEEAISSDEDDED
jgi:hypothetical protein